MKELGPSGNPVPRILESLELEFIPLDHISLDAIFNNLSQEEQQRYFDARNSIIQARAVAPLNEGNLWIID